MLGNNKPSVFVFDKLLLACLNHVNSSFVLWKHICHGYADNFIFDNENDALEACSDESVVVVLPYDRAIDNKGKFIPESKQIDQYVSGAITLIHKDGTKQYFV